MRGGGGVDFEMPSIAAYMEECSKVYLQPGEPPTTPTSLDLRLQCKKFRLLKATNHRTADKLAVSRYLNYHFITVKNLGKKSQHSFQIQKARVPAIILPLIRVYSILVRLKAFGC